MGNAFSSPNRNLKQFSRATALYSLGLKRFPENPQFSVGLALCLYDSNNTSHADLVLQQAQKRFAHNDDILFTIATTYEYHRNYFEALRIYQTLITRPTTRTKSLINLIGVLRKLKMPFRAQHYVDANPALFDDTTRAAIRSDEAAFELRWALKGYYLHSNQTLLNDALNKINRNLLSFNLNRPETLSLKLVQNSIFDKTAVLNAMGRTHAAIALHDTYAAEGLSFPSYALTAVAEAHLDQKNPKRSQKLLHEALRKDPNNFKAKVLLFYAYSDAYDMHDALAFAAKLDAQETPNIWDRQHLYKMTNPRKLETTILHILSLEYAGYMDSAESRLETLVAKAPANGWLRSTLAKLYYYRGWYDKAKQEYTLLLHQNPDSFTAKEGMILSQLMQRDYEKSYQNIEALQKEYPRKTKALQELNKAYEQSRQGSFSVASRFGDTPTQSSVGSSSGYYINSRLYSPRFNTHYRVFLDAQRSYEKLYGTKLQNYRYGAGLNYTSKTFDANILLAYNAKNIRRFAPSIDLQYALNDYLKVGGGYALFSSQSPLRGLVHGTRADRLFATLSYRYSDEQESALSLEQVDFTDGNLRYALGLRHFQHLIDGPYYNLDGYVYAGATQNSKDDALYYNPNNDAYLSFEAKNSWVLYRFYDISIRQTLGLEFGVHWERDYGSKSTGAFSVAQEWRLHENFGFGFGYLRKRSSYDGNLEYKNEFFLNLDGRF
ncbi:MAG: poly-beta-1,6 N-acetyl-D-glucosamine export porin PgaA [Sulfurimonas sp.]|nr:MAG: poly-beta-1,6 N-acetyl-D-glucosamine export porin PgaA [Sulfurimonas sp.]